MSNTIFPGNDQVSVAELLSDAVFQSVLFSIYQAVQRDWRHAPRTLASRLRQTRSLHSRKRRVLHEALFAFIRFRRRYLFVHSGIVDENGLGQDPPEALFLGWLWSQAPPGELCASAFAGAGLDIARATNTPARLAALPSPLLRLAIWQSFPDWLVAKLAAEWGLEQTDKLLTGLNQRAPFYGRVNRQRASPSVVLAHLAQQGVLAQMVSASAATIEILGHGNVGQLKAFQDGLFDVQDLGSQLIAELVAPPPKGCVLDVCAGAGGKTLAIASALENLGRVYSYDPDQEKLFKLQKRARRQGLSNIELLSAAALAKQSWSWFDRILIDAPCSGIGAMRRSPETRWRLHPEDLPALRATQAELLKNYAPRVRAGGLVIYATCTLTADENEHIIDAFVRDHCRFRLLPIGDLWGRERALQIGDGSYLRLAPHRHNTDGFFAAVLQKK